MLLLQILRRNNTKAAWEAVWEDGVFDKKMAG